MRIREVADRCGGPLKIWKRRIQLTGDNCSNVLGGLGGRPADFRPIPSSKSYGRQRLTDGGGVGSFSLNCGLFKKVKLGSLHSSMFVRNFCSSASADAIVSVGPDTPPVSSCLLLGDHHDGHDSQSYCFYSLSEKKIFTMEKNRTWKKDALSGAKWVGSSHGWIAFINPRDCNLYLSNLFSPTSPIIPLPPIETLPSVIARYHRRPSFVKSKSQPKSNCLSESESDDDDDGDGDGEAEGEEDEGDDQIFFVKSEGEGDGDGDDDIFDTSFMLLKDPLQELVSAYDLSKRLIHKIVLSSPPPSPSNNYANYSNCTAAIIYGSLDSSEKPNELAFCKLGGTSWTPLGSMTKLYHDILFSASDPSVLYAFQYNGVLEAWDLSSMPPKRSVLKCFNPWNGCTSKGHLVESSSGDLLVAYRYLDWLKTTGFGVHRLDLADRKWIPVECLGDEVFFVGGGNSAMSVCAGDFPELIPNSIYFTDTTLFEYKDEGEGRPHLGVFSLEDNTVRTFENLSLSIVQEKMKKMEAWPVWVAPNPW